MNSHGYGLVAPRCVLDDGRGTSKAVRDITVERAAWLGVAVATGALGEIGQEECDSAGSTRRAHRKGRGLKDSANHILEPVIDDVAELLCYNVCQVILDHA
ncbi:hypothetical protein MPH_13318 [Macrophomina phaseolina MS6]|uniref:Uncharacterized protein n=1 Tax=Macrophomina phaseolina (strain MS6) TaxID=1126212 RepID=K2RYW7_MACPH|nr:hypothetical protein MPH_13318 [Macrophomina phaseolina MS6]